MKSDLAENVDLAAERLVHGEPLDSVLAAFPAEKESLSPALQAVVALRILAEEAVPAPVGSAAERQVFLAEAARRRARGVDPAGTRAATAIEPLPAQAVSIGFLARLKGWTKVVATWFAPAADVREERKMVPILVRATFILVLALGSFGGTVALAADSLPGSPVYPVKLAVERARLALTADPAGDARLHLAYAAERVTEMEKVMERGGVPDETTVERLRFHLRQALAIAAHQSEESLLDSLAQAHRLVQMQARLMERAQENAGEPSRAQMELMVEAVHRLRREIEQGLADPLNLRNRQGAGHPDSAPRQPEGVPGSGPVITHTRPVTGPHGFGPGPAGSPDCLQTGDCEPAGSQQQHQGPPPEPGDYNQNCPQGDGSCQPAGDQHQYGDGPGPAENPEAAPEPEPERNGGSQGEMNGAGGGEHDPGSGDGGDGGGPGGGGAHGGAGSGSK